MKQEDPNQILNDVTSNDYKYGFVTDIETEVIPTGLCKNVIRLISQKKGEPEWLLEFRLKAYEHWKTLKMPHWAHLDIPSIDYQAISYYAAPKKKEGPKSLDEVDPELLKTFNKLGISLEEQMKLPVVVGNDANLMGLGEAKYGAGRGCTHVVFLTVGTGIGGAVIIDGKLFNGYANRGTELGHVPLIANGERCACGAIGCLEHYASTSALVRHFSTLAKERNLSFDMEINGELIVRLYHENFPMAVECMSEHFYYLGRGIAGFVNIFSPQRIVLGGGVTESGIFYLEKIREVVREHVIADCALNTEIVAASLGNKAGFIGAASLILK